VTAAANPRVGLALALAGFATFSIGDAVVKSMAGAWPGTAISALRFAVALAGMAAFIAITRGRAGFICPLPRIQFARGASLSMATLSVFMAVQLMPLADATAVQFVSPMLTAILSALVLGERAPRAVWVASLLALAGVLAILRPNVLALGPAALFPLGNALGMACLMLLNRRAANAADALTMQFLVALFATPILIAVAIAGHVSGAVPVPWPSMVTVLKVASVACTASLGHALIYLATTRAPAAIVAPMMYVQILVAATFGWVIFGTALGWATLAGAALIISGGLWLWHSQRPRRVEDVPIADLTD
jgi:drug/metabolite transporter (DMT)-like permease